LGPDVLTLQEIEGEEASTDHDRTAPGESRVLLAAPKLQPTAETDLIFYRRKQKAIVIRHVSGDRIVAVVELVSRGNKMARNALRAFVAKAAELLEKQIHLLILDLFPPGPRDPNGIHAEIWQEIAGAEYSAPKDRPLTLAAYESGLTVRAYVAPTAVGETLADMPLFLEPQRAVHVPLEATYTSAFAETPRRWRRVIER
jgi:hypothetical protein